MTEACSKSQLSVAIPISSCAHCSDFLFDYCVRQLPRLFKSKLCEGNYMSLAERTDTYSNHHLRILRKRHRKMA